MNAECHPRKKKKLGSVTKSMHTVMDIRCVTCFSPGRDLKPLKDKLLLAQLCPQSKFTSYDMICWECQYIIKKIRLFKCKVVKAQALFKHAVRGVYKETAGLSELKIGSIQTQDIPPENVEPELFTDVEIKYDPEIMSDPEIKPDPDPSPLCPVRYRIKFEQSDDELMDDAVTGDEAVDSEWSDYDKVTEHSEMIGENSKESTSDNLIINDADTLISRVSARSILNEFTTQASDWLQSEKKHVPKMSVKPNTMTLKDLLEQPLQYPSPKSKAKAKKIQDGETSLSNDSTEKQDTDSTGVAVDSNGEMQQNEGTDVVYQCVKCSLKFDDLDMFEAHKENHGNKEDEISCEECKSKFLSKQELAEHKNTSYLCMKYSCDCGKKFAEMSQLEQHIETGHEPSFLCPACPNVFLDKTSLKRHYDNIHLNGMSPKEKTCTYCGRQYKRVANLRAHLRIHDEYHQDIQAGIQKK